MGRHDHQRFVSLGSSPFVVLVERLRVVGSDGLRWHLSIQGQRWKGFVCRSAGIGCSGLASLGNKGLTKSVLSMESGFGALSGTGCRTSGGPKAPKPAGDLHLCAGSAGEVESGNKGASGHRWRKVDALLHNDVLAQEPRRKLRPR